MQSSNALEKGINQFVEIMISTLQIYILCLMSLVLCVDIFLSFLNECSARRRMKSMPEELGGLMDMVTWEKSSNYLISKTKLSYLQKIISFAFISYLLIHGLPVYMNSLLISSNLGALGISFWGGLLVTILSLPSLFFDWIQQFVIEEKFGFNTSSGGLWVTDKIKEITLMLFFSFFIFSILTFSYDLLIDWFPKLWWIFSFFIFFLIQIVILFLAPRLILPLFNKLTPLEDEELAQLLTSLCRKRGFELSKIEVMDGSKRSSHSNAFFTGFGKARRIIFYDTLLEQLSHKQIESVLAHEIGHYKLNHLPKRLLLSCLFGVVFFGLLDYSMHSSFLFEQLQLDPNLVGNLVPVILYFMIFGSCLTYWFSFLSNYYSRKHEFEADAFAVNSVGGWTDLSSALRIMHVKNLSYPSPHPLYALFNHSHPSLLERELKMKAALIKPN